MIKNTITGTIDIILAIIFYGTIFMDLKVFMSLLKKMS